MDPEVSTQNAKQRILDTAGRIFAEKGFDGARVDEIARRAGVNKALIYYYFKSKEELLAVLFKETRDAALGLIHSPALTALDMSSKDDLRTMLQAFLDVLEERQDIVRVMLMESVKRTPINDLIFSIIGEILQQMFAVAANTDIPENPDHQAAMVTEFFTGIMPLLNYVAYHEIWMDRFGIDEPKLRANFIDSFMGTHFAYTMNIHDGKL